MKARERGAASVELGLLLPALMVLVAMAAPMLKAGWEYMVVSRAVSSGVRYASRVDVNARVSPTGTLTRRPTAAEVQQVVVSAASPLAPGSVTVVPDPSTSLPGEPITVTASFEVTFGPLAQAANAVSNLFFNKPGAFPVQKLITVSSRGREE